jgi:GT2 family glycosyltransferase
MLKFSLIICTKDRPKDLKLLLESVQKQSRLPDQIIIVDGSDHPIKELVESFKTLPLIYQTVRPPGLAKQRNVGIKLLRDDIDWVGMLDDDLELEAHCLQNLEEYLLSHPTHKGVGLVINNQPVFKKHIYRSIFFTDREPGGLITLSGSAAAIRPVEQDLEVEWLYGGATFWNKSVFSEFSYDEWFSGVGYLEDVDFSYRVSRKYKLSLSAKSRCWHYQHPMKKEKLKAHAAWHFVAWWYFATKYNFNKLIVLWSMFGVFLSNLGIGLFKPQTNRLLSTLGNLKALWVIMTGGVANYKGFQK